MPDTNHQQIWLIALHIAQPRFIPTPWVTLPTFGFVRIIGGGE
jgi:hypothetical protein